MIDIHNHMIYGVDDGSKSIEESIDILRDLYNNGVSDVILTPHFIPETKYVSPKLNNIVKFKKIKEELKSNNININLYLGNEIYIDKNIYNYIKTNQMCSLNNTEYILVELPMSGEYEDYQDIFYNLIDIGFTVILAHPERYRSVQGDFNKIYELKDQGILFQCNIGSLVGEYGNEAKKVIKRLLKEHLVSFIGTDIHKKKNDYSYINKSINKMKKYISDDELQDILVNNARKIIKK
ncbi:MAG: hypothetical protein IJH20_04395 [Bacilli bacterium]|nr:hypothetical protein [Bacilli bacterium]